MSELPHNLRIELSLYIHEETYKNIFFLTDKTISFIAWVCPQLKTYIITEGEYVYFEGDEIVNMYFMKSGLCGYVLPKFNNTKYIEITKGCDFGTEDIGGSLVKNDKLEERDWINQKE
jgi:hypothetical protein